MAIQRSPWVLEGLPNTEPPRGIRHFARFMVAMGILVFAVLIFVPWQQNIPGKGELIAYSPLERQQDIESPIKGQIKRWYVQEGTTVKKGDLIAEISDVDPDYLERLLQQRQNLQQQVEFGQGKVLNYMERVNDFDAVLNSTRSAGEAKVAAIEQQSSGVEQELAGADASVMTAQKNLERETILQEKGLSSTRKLELTTLKYQDALAKRGKIQAKLRELVQKRQAAFSDLNKALATSEAKIRSSRADLQQTQKELADTESKILKLDTSIARQRRQEIRAPKDGRILKLTTFSEAAYVKEGDKLATLVPNAEQNAVELYINGNDIVLVHVGDQVRLQFEGWPAIQFSGWPGASLGTFSGTVQLIDPTYTLDKGFRVVALPGEGEDGLWPTLPQGVNVKGWVMLTSVPIGYELWRQFNGFPPQFKQPVEKSPSTEVIKRKKAKK
jgi:membrane fusion protein, adhesin transport system